MAADQLSKKSPDGTLLGQSATDKIGFYGLATPIVQPTVITSIGATATTALLKARINSINAALRALNLVASA